MAANRYRFLLGGDDDVLELVVIGAQLSDDAENH